MMFQFRSWRMRSHLLPFMVFACWTLFHFSGVAAGVPADAEYGRSAVADSVCLFTLRNGVCEPQFFTQRQLAQGLPLESQGYVVGVVVFGPNDLRVELGDQRFRPIQSNADGTFQVQGYGTINPADLAARNRSGEGLPATTLKPPGRTAEVAYSYFPKVFGDAVSPQARFELQLERRDSRQTLAVNQQQIQAVDLSARGAGPASSSSFHYVGHRLDLLLNRPSDFALRLAAIEEGIRLVEESLQIDLVQNVQLIDLNQRNNALTYEGRSTIWFYVDTVLGTSLEELRHIATHETLHQLVYRLRLTRSPELRRLFADLWGLDNFSVARFQLVTTGWFDSQNSRLSPSGNLFFSFINEKNFIRGMHGGHSHDNLDEFLTSLIHALLYIQNLPGNLQTPIGLYGSNDQHSITDGEKSELLRLFRTSVDLLVGAAQTAQADSSDQKRDLHRFFHGRLAAVERLTPTAPTTP